MEAAVGMRSFSPRGGRETDCERSLLERIGPVSAILRRCAIETKMTEFLWSQFGINSLPLRACCGDRFPFPSG
jgi:hypothetical protein